MTAGSAGFGVLRLTDTKTYEGTWQIEGAWVRFEGRRRHHANGGVLFSEPGVWVWPAKRVTSITADIEQEVTR